MEPRLELMRPEHLDDVVELVREFYGESLKVFGLSVDPKAVSESFLKCEKSTIVLVDKDRVVGIIAGMLITAPHSSELIWKEIVWFVKREYRGQGVRLYDQMEGSLLAIGVKKMVMVLLCNEKEEKIDIFYKSLGYKRMEVEYIKDIS